MLSGTGVGVGGPEGTGVAVGTGVGTGVGVSVPGTAVGGAREKVCRFTGSRVGTGSGVDEGSIVDGDCEADGGCGGSRTTASDSEQATSTTAASRASSPKTDVKFMSQTPCNGFREYLC